MATSAAQPRDVGMRWLGCLLLMLAGTPALAEGRAAAATPNAAATAAAMQTLRAGGTAADAAVAAQMVLGVVTPQAAGIGGGGLALSYNAANRTVVSWDGREAAPAAAAAGAAAGGGSVGVPGLLSMLEALHREHGRLPWAELIAPAIREAERATPPNLALAEVLRVVATAGAAGMMRGVIAAEIATAVRSDSVPGLLTTDDLAAYAARRAPAVCGPYRGRLVCSVGPPSTGGAMLLEALGLLERFELGTLDPGGADAAMLVVEAEQLAAHGPGGSPDQRALLMDPAYAIDPRSIDPAPAAEYGTASLAVWDSAGNAVCLTGSLGGPAGSHLVVHGVVLNAALAQFSPANGVDRQAGVDRIEPGKRPATAMTPAMVLAGDGALQAVAGSTGGGQLPDFVLQALTGVVDWGMDPADAVARPHRLAQGSMALLEAGPDAAALATALEARGETVAVEAVPSGTVLIVTTPAGLQAAADPREAGVAASE